MAVLMAGRPASRRSRLRRTVADNLLAYAFMAAGIACFALFSWYPLVRGIVLSFQQVNFVTDPYWVGLDNFRALFADPLFWTAWTNMGGATLMYLAALQGIPGELYEAAELDGATVWQRLRHVTIPQMRFIL